MGAEKKRRRNAAATREAILRAAARLFASAGYEGAGAREIAASAGVTAALINRYFGSKEKLFAEVLDYSFRVDDLFDGDCAQLGARLARRLAEGPARDPDQPAPLLLLLRAATAPRAARLLRGVLERKFVHPLAEKIGGPDAEARAALVIAALCGFAVLNETVRVRAIVKGQRRKIEAHFARALQTLIERRPA